MAPSDQNNDDLNIDCCSNDDDDVLFDCSNDDDVKTYEVSDPSVARPRVAHQSSSCQSVNL